MKVLNVLLFLSVLASCRSPKLVEAPSIPVTIEGDSLLFDGIEERNIAYSILSNVLHVSAALKPGKKLSVPISHPTLFSEFVTSYTVYPGENIQVTKGADGYPLFTVKENEQRNREFLFEVAFQRMHQKVKPNYPSRIKEYPIDTILLFEQQVQAEMPDYITRSNTLLDSLATAYAISDSFKRLARIALEVEQKGIIHSLYSTYQQELKKHNLYAEKLKRLLPLFNAFNEREQIHFRGSLLIGWILPELYAEKGRIRNEKQLKEAMDTVNEHLFALSRDYFLTDILYHALYREVPVSKKTMRYYYRSCKDVAYESIVRNLLAQKKKYAVQARRKKDNRLIAFSDEKIYTLDDVLTQQKGKLILIDIWASWCAPCLEQQSYMEKLQQRWKGENIIFLYLSMDKELNRWRQRNIDFGLDPNLSFVFENFEKQSFLKKYNIDSFPRYLLIDENGNMINDNIPMPNSGELEKLIKAYLKKE